MIRTLSCFIALSCFSLSPTCADEIKQPFRLLCDGLRPFQQVLAGKDSAFDLQGHVTVQIDKKPQDIQFRLTRFDDVGFELQLDHKQYAIRLVRQDDTTELVLPKHRTRFIGRGNSVGKDHLSPLAIIDRLVAGKQLVSSFVNAQAQEPNAVAIMLAFTDPEFDAEQKQWSSGDFTWSFPDSGGLSVTAKNFRLKARLQPIPKQPPSRSLAVSENWDEFKTTELDRSELEWTVFRGLRRAGEVLEPGAFNTPPSQSRKVEHGELRVTGTNRVALLQGSPEQVGKAHGQLLRAEAQHCIDSVLCLFGTVQTVRTGTWFRHDLDAAYARLARHIPDRHKLETQAMADQLGLDRHLVQALNVFPELFHCSGFAVFGKATKDGKLYHGRVLDYMTTIGLQDAATIFVVKLDGRIPFVNVGYAGFIGSVTGMNAKSISLGEMGGRGEGQWDGVPMATLMRRALEECETLDQVKQLWTESPRTCEYFYVFADGKTNQAVGVSATPEKLEFVLPGQTHPLLGQGIEDAVVLSAGSRLQKLRERVIKTHGRIDSGLAVYLMSRPVAMQSNLHNVLFIPADGDFLVANATHDKPAAERPYSRFNLQKLLASMK